MRWPLVNRGFSLFAFGDASFFLKEDTTPKNGSFNN